MNKRIIAVSLIVFCLALYVNVFPFHEEVPLKKPFADFPMNWKGWTGRSFFFDSDILERLNVSEYVTREYRKGGNRFNIYIGYYRKQREGAQIHSPKHCLPGGGWFRLSEKKRSINVDNVGKVDFIEAVYKKGEHKEIFAYWYKMKNAYITNEYILKFYMVFNSLRYRRNDAAFIRLSAPATDSVDNASVVLDDAMNDFLPLLKDFLPE